MEDCRRSGQPATAHINYNARPIEQIIYADGRLKIREITDKLNLLNSDVHRIIYEDLKFLKVCAR